MLAHTWHVTSFLCMTAYGVSRRVENHLENHVAVEAVSRFPYVGGITLRFPPSNPLQITKKILALEARLATRPPSYSLLKQRKLRQHAAVAIS